MIDVRIIIQTRILAPLFSNKKDLTSYLFSIAFTRVFYKISLFCIVLFVCFR